MKTLKKNNISQGSSINSPVPVNKDCDLPPFFNTDYFSHVVVQTLEELESIPCKLRQDGMVATVVQEDYSDYQLQSSRIGFSKCDNRSWVRIGKGDAVYDGNNLMIFSDLAELGRFLQSQYSRQGQLIYVQPENRYLRVKEVGATKILEDPSLEKLTKPTEKTSAEDDDLLIPVYKDGQPPLWKSYSEFGRVHTVNGLESDVNKNISIGLDEVLKVGPPKEEDLESSLKSKNRFLLFDPITNISYWKNISDFSTGDFTTIDSTIQITNDRDIFVNYNNVQEDVIIKAPFTLPLKVKTLSRFNEISQVTVNEKHLQRQFYFVIDNSTIELRKNIEKIITDNPSELRVIISGVKFLNN